MLLMYTFCDTTVSKPPSLFCLLLQLQLVLGSPDSCTDLICTFSYTYSIVVCTYSSQHHSRAMPPRKYRISWPELACARAHTWPEPQAIKRRRLLQHSPTRTLESITIPSPLTYFLLRKMSALSTGMFLLLSVLLLLHTASCRSAGQRCNKYDSSDCDQGLACVAISVSSDIAFCERKSC